MAGLRGTWASAHLDAIRAVAALAVFASHLRGKFFVDWDGRLVDGLAAKGVYFLTGFAHQAVLVFFVLSGYLVGGAVLRLRRSGEWSWSRYLVARLTRLWVVLLPALLLGGLLDLVTRTWFGARMVAPGLTDVSFTVATFFGNLFFLQNVLVPWYGSNAPLWSLSLELWYYVAFPFVVAAWLQPGLRASVLCALAAVGILALTGPLFAAYFFIWALGAAVWLFPVPSARLGRVLTAAGALAGAALLVFIRLRPDRPMGFLTDLGVAAAVTLLLAGIRAEPGLRSEGPLRHGLGGAYARAAAWFAGFSYSLYLTHYPALVLLRALVFPSSEARWIPGPLTALQGGAIAVVVLGYALGLSRLTEAHTEAVRDLLLRRLGRQRAFDRVDPCRPDLRLPP
jgi:peptidoglycan/LPS O-acetylase OafA/YrhL